MSINNLCAKVKESSRKLRDGHVVLNGTFEPESINSLMSVLVGLDLPDYMQKHAEMKLLSRSTRFGHGAEPISKTQITVYVDYKRGVYEKREKFVDLYDY